VWAAGYGYVWAKCRLQMVGLDCVGKGQTEWHFVGVSTVVCMLRCYAYVAGLSSDVVWLL